MSAQACVPNIGPRERRRRLIAGVVFSGMTLAIAAYLLASGAPRGWRALIVLPAAMAAVGVFQVQAKTCVALAARGVRNMDQGDESMTDAHELARVRAQARGVYIKASLAALAAAAILLLI